MRWTITVLLLLHFFCNRVYAQVTYLEKQIDNRDGLSNSCINTVFQDSDDLMWFGSWDGLNLYNGTSMHVFNYGKEIARNYLSSNIILNLNEDRNRNVWAGTVDGVSKIDKQTGRLTNYFYNNLKASSNGFVLTITERGKIYTSRRNTSTVSYYNPSTDNFVNCNISHLIGMITDIKTDYQGNLWILKNSNVLEFYHLSAKGFEKSFNVPDIKSVSRLFFVNKHIFYTTLDGYLYQIDHLSKSIKLSRLPHEVRAITYYQNHYIFAWSSKGIGEYTADFKPDPFITKDIKSLANVRITSLYSGKENILWLGSDGSGVIKIIKKPSYFGAFLKQPNGQPFSIPVRAFCIVNKELWVGTKGNGIITIKNWGQPNIQFSGTRLFSAGEDLLDNCVYSIEKGKDNYIYIGSDAPGITLYDQSLKKFIYWKDIKGSKDYPSFNSVHCVLYDKDSSIWLGLNAMGLIHLQIKKDAKNHPYIKYLKNYTYDGSNNGPANNVIYSLVEGSNNTIWVGCRYGGLSLFDKATGKFKNLKAFSYDRGLSNNDILSLYIDQSKRLWVGTSYGLNWTDEPSAIKVKKPVFKSLNTDNGLPNNTIHAITEDKEKNIWISTNKGIAKIDPLTLKIVNFKQADGLQSDEFSDNAVWKANSDEIFFGGIYGFNYFQPKKVQVNTMQPQLMLSDFQLAGRKVNMNIIKVLNSSKAVSSAHYELKPQDNYFEQKVEFISYINPQKCQYSYLLDGNDMNWHNATHDQAIFYNNLAPGNYTLSIKWSNGEGGWTKPVVAYTLTVEQYFWLTPIAFGVYILVLSASAFLYYRYKKNKFLLRQQFVIEHMLREKDEKLHQKQLNYFTNIAHELQTPLTIISGTLERYFYKVKNGIKERSNENLLLAVNEQSSRLNFLVYQLLEFRKAEEGHLKNHFSYLNASNLLFNISELFTPLANQKGIDFSLHIQPDIQLWTDKDKLEKIIFNLLSNAIKHTGNNQYVIVSLNKKIEDQSLELIIANSGCTITQEQLNNLFTKFFVSDDTQQTKISTGLGLAFTQQLVSLLNGTIGVNFENTWIHFKTNLPLNYQPQKHEVIGDNQDKDSPSYLLSSIISKDSKSGQISSEENNKEALLTKLNGSDKKSILVIEDEDGIRFLLNDVLKEYYIIYEAANGKEALELINKVMPDLIVSDVMMPDMSGLEICHHIKNLPHTCHIPFLILSAKGTIDQQIEGYEAGADAYIPKPFNTEHLLVRIKRLLEYHDKLHIFFKHDSIIDNLPSSGMKDDDKAFLEKTITLIETNIELEELDALYLEKQLGMSKAYFYRRLKTLSGMTPGELIKKVRLQHTAALLQNSNMTVSEVFYRSGFNNQSHFFREFKKQYNISPNEYRLQFKVV